MEGAAPRTVGDVVEYLETLAAELVDGRAPDPDWPATNAVLDTVETTIRPRLAASGPAEIAALLAGLDGKFIAPGPSGAPSRGRLDVLPTGRNFYSVDNRAVPTPDRLGARPEVRREPPRSAISRITAHQLRSLALSVWGTANMRTGGDDIAQALALIGATPDLGPVLAPRLRLRDHPARQARPPARRRDPAHLRLLPRRLPGPDRAVRQAIRAIGALDEPDGRQPASPPACAPMRSS